MTTIGIPRALLYYTFYPFWKEYFQKLGLKVVVSNPTQKNIINKGGNLAVDETCLPMKVYYGHVSDLCSKADLIFIPRIVSVEKNAFICPKFMGLPDMIRSSFSRSPQIIDATIDIPKNRLGSFSSFRNIGKMFSSNSIKIYHAYLAAYRKQRHYCLLQKQGYLPEHAMDILAGAEKTPINNTNGSRIGVVGHPYVIYDKYVSMNIIDRLKKFNISIITPDMLMPRDLKKVRKTLRKELFWTFGRKIINSIGYFQEIGIDGIIYIFSFACGIDSIVGELAERRCNKRGNTPLLRINMDEHTGQAGVLTRLEAFIDMIKWKEMAK